MLKHFVPRSAFVLRAVQVRMASSEQEAYVPFGMKNVRKEEKAAKVGDVFTNVAKKYDLMNDLMSFGVHRVWKNHLVETRLKPSPRHRILDIGGGTGDIAFRMVDFMSDQTKKIEGSVTILDPNEAMMEVGKKRAEENGTAKALKWVVGTGEALPFGDGEFDAITQAFSLRNCTDPHKVIEEAFRILRPGGRFMILEFFMVKRFPVSALYDFYLDFLPVTGFVVMGNWSAYQYLADSIRRMNPQNELMAHMRKVGFADVECEKMIPFGVACILSGKKPV